MSDAFGSQVANVKGLFLAAVVLLLTWLQVTLERPGEAPVVRQYQGRGSAGLNLAGTSGAVGKSLALALRDAIAQMRAEVDVARRCNSATHVEPEESVRIVTEHQKLLTTLAGGEAGGVQLQGAGVLPELQRSATSGDGGAFSRLGDPLSGNTGLDRRSLCVTAW